MLISPIIEKEILYINLHAEQSFYGTFNADILEISKNIITGIYIEELNKSVLYEVYEYIKINKAKFKILALDFSKLMTAQKNIDDVIFKIKGEVENIILCNIHNLIVDRLALDEYRSKGNKLESSTYETFILNESTDFFLKDVNRTKIVFDLKFKEVLEQITVSKEGVLHHSSSVYLSKFIDIKELIVNHKNFFFYTCYWLAIEMNKKNDFKRSWVIEKADKKILLCQNLNSSFIAAILSSFLLLDVITLDHIGPINKVYNEIEKKIKKGEEYIVISDVVCLGTEVRIAKNIIEFSGGKYIGNVTLIRIMTMKEDERFTDTESIYEISKQNNPINFEIKTALTI